MHCLQRLYKTTIILTSSDSEECSRSDFVLYFKQGQIHECTRPSNLLQKLNVDTMEKAFYCLGVKLGEAEDNSNSEPPPPEPCSIEEHERTKKYRYQYQSNINDIKDNQPHPLSYISYCVLAQDKALSIWRNKWLYLFLGTMIPSMLLILSYFSIGHNLKNSEIGVCKFFFINKFFIIISFLLVPNYFFL